MERLTATGRWAGTSGEDGAGTMQLRRWGRLGLAGGGVGLTVYLAGLLLLAWRPGPLERVVKTMRGEPVAGAAVTDTAGYYERLLTETEAEADGGARRAGPVMAKAPEGWRAFAESGIVDEVGTYVRWQMRPSLATQWNGQAFSTNARGYRTPEVAVPKPAGTWRVVLMGSSNTMGHGVADDEVYPRLVERWWNERLGGEAATASAAVRRVEIVNLAVSGDSPSRRLARLLEEAAAYEPDLLWIDASPLDVSLEEVHLYNVLKRGLPVPFGFVRTVLEETGLGRGDATLARVKPRVQARFAELLDGTYAGYTEAARQWGIDAWLLILPRADSDAPATAVVDQMASIARRRGLRVIDLSGAFKGLGESEFRVAPYDLHPSREGHRAIAAGLAEAIEARWVGAAPQGIGPRAVSHR